MDTWIWMALAGAAVLAIIIIGIVAYQRARRRSTLQRHAPVAAKPAVPTKDLIDLALKKREEALAAQRERMEAAAQAASRPPPPVLPYPMPSRTAVRAPPTPEPVIEVSSSPAEPAVNPVQKMALEQWDDVEVVSRNAPPAAGADIRRAHKKPEEFEMRPTQTKAPARPLQAPELFEARPSTAAKKVVPFEADWGDVEVRRDVKKR